MNDEPSDGPWPTATIGDLFDIGAGKSVTPASRNSEPRFPFLRTSNVFWGRIDVSEVDSMHFTPEEIETKSLRRGDLLVCEGGDIGRSAIWNGELTQCCFQNHLHRLRPLHDNVAPRYAMYYLQAGFTQLGIYEGAGNKTTIPNLSRSRLASLSIPLPPKPEQQKIAAALWKLQRAIATQDKLLKATADLKASAMQRLFIHGLRGEPLKDTEIGPMPESWKITPIGQLVDIRHGYSFKSEYFRSKGAIVLTPGNFNIDGGLYWGPKTKFTIEPYGSELVLQPGDLVVVMTDLTPSAKLLGSPGFIPGGATVLHNQRIGKVIVTSDEILPEFLYCVFLTSRYRDYVVQTATGSTVRHTSPGRIKRFDVALPQPDEQRAIASTLAALDRKLAHHRAKRAALHDLFQTLLHQLMTGALRVDALNIDVSEVAEPVSPPQGAAA